MCVVSMVTDWSQKQWPGLQQGYIGAPDNTVSRAEFLKLKGELEELKKLLIAAKKFDEATGQPDCEKEKNVVAIKKMAEFLGVDLSEVFK